MGVSEQIRMSGQMRVSVKMRVSVQMGVPEQMKVSVQMGVSEHIIRMNQRLGKVICGWWWCIWKIASALVPFEI